MADKKSTENTEEVVETPEAVDDTTPEATPEVVEEASSEDAVVPEENPFVEEPVGATATGLPNSDYYSVASNFTTVSSTNNWNASGTVVQDHQYNTTWYFNN